MQMCELEFWITAGLFTESNPFFSCFFELRPCGSTHVKGINTEARTHICARPASVVEPDMNIDCSFLICLFLELGFSSVVLGFFAVSGQQQV